jgi:hypothetical protein
MWVNKLYGELILKVLLERPEILAKPIPAGLPPISDPAVKQ